MSTEHFLSNEFLSWFHNHFKQSLSEKSFSLYLHYAGTFSKAIGKDFLDYEKEDADFYCSILRSHMEEGVIKPKSVYNEIAILSSIAKALEDSLQIPDFFSAQERPVIEYAPLSEQRLPSTSEFDTILSVAQNYDPSGTMAAALYLIGVYALSRAEVISLSSENIFLQNDGLIIKRKEFKVRGVSLPKLILLDTMTANILLPFFNNMKKKADESADQSTVFLFYTRKGKPFTPRYFSDTFNNIISRTGFSYTLRDIRAGALTRIAHLGGSDALFETVGLRSFWGERYVAASSMLSSGTSELQTTNAYSNFVFLPKDSISKLLETVYHYLNQDANNINVEIRVVSGIPSADITFDGDRHLHIDETGEIIEN